jgi:dTDP-4-amino-4,6-dideoxygalactose transaminase
VSAAFLPFSEPWVGADEMRELLATLDSGWLTTGPRTERFERAFREYVGTQEALATNSCTAALHLALRALDIGPGDAVVTSPFTFAATANVIVHCGAEVLFADIHPDSYNLDPAAVEGMCLEQCEPEPGGGLRVTRSGNRLRAIVAVHYGGQSCAMDELGALAGRFRLVLLEDAAHAAGARYRGRPVGALGHAACFSFYPTKNMTTGEGGMLTTDDRTLAARARRLSQHGISRDGWQRYCAEGSWRYDVEEAGFKYNMADLQAALGLHQLKRLDGFVERRRRLAALYDRALAGRPDLIVPREQPGCFHSRHLYPVEITSQSVSRDRFIERLRERRIGSSVHFIPLHLTSFYQRSCGFRRGDFPVAERVFERIVSLPIYPAMSDEQAAQVVEACVESLEEPDR